MERQEWRFMRDKPNEVRRNYILRALFTINDRKHFMVLSKKKRKKKKEKKKEKKECPIKKNFLSSAFCCIYYNDNMVFVIHSVNGMYHIYGFVCVEPFLHPSEKSHFVMVYSLFN